MFIVICEYEGYRQSDPLGKFQIEAIGPMEHKEAVEYAEKNLFEGCKKHTVARLIEVS